MNTIDKIICDVLRIPESELDGNLSIDSVDGWDSLSHMDLIASIEDAFDFELTIDEILEMRCVNQIRTIVSRKML